MSQTFGWTVGEKRRLSNELRQDLFVKSSPKLQSGLALTDVDEPYEPTQREMAAV
jgi:hypothetical protein